MKIKYKGHTLEVAPLKPDEVITKYHLMRYKHGMTREWKPSKRIGGVVRDCPDFQYVRVLSPFYNPKD